MMGVVRSLGLLHALSFPTRILAAAGVSLSASDALPAFASFVAKHGRAYSEGTAEYDLRRAVYEQRLELIQRHNSRSQRLWDAAVNHLSDRTDAELSRLRGLRVIRKAGNNGVNLGAVGPHRHAHFLGQVKNTVLPEEKSWAHLKAAKKDVDQGACGSCWAVSTATMLQANAEINGYNRSFSAQELVDCVPNPHHCGGAGGCDGSTMELAMNWVSDHGLDTEVSTPYAGADAACKKQKPSFLAQDGKLDDMIAVGFHASRELSQSALGLNGWERLPENDYEPLMRAVAMTGPAVVSVGAGEWFSYNGGVFDGCDKNTVIDHAVTLIGYGKDTQRNAKFWNIKNSWGLSWGEGGNIRLLRHDGAAPYCGIDNEPQKGTGCDGGPSSVKVCGMCGVLYDSVVAYFHK